MFNFFKSKNIYRGIFNGHFIDAKAFYVAKFNKVACVTFIGDLDVSKAFSFVCETYNSDISATYQHAYFNHDDKEVYFNNTIIVLTFERMIEVAENYCQLLHTSGQYNWARTLVNDLAQFRIEKDAATAYRHVHVIGFAKETTMN